MSGSNPTDPINNSRRKSCPDMSGQQSKACGAYNFSFAGANPTFIDQNLCHTGLLE
jgi:hypothetical protein